MGYWDVIAKNSIISTRQIAQQALIAPAKCCIKNVDMIGTDGDVEKKEVGSHKISNIEERIVEKAFLYVRHISGILKEEFGF